MKTEILSVNKHSVEKAANLLASDFVVAIPTETVYGLAANGFSREGVSKIFAAKGRPSDNPLILHISNFNMLNELVEEIPYSAEILMKRFWPGALTIIFPKSNKVINEVNGGLNTVAVRFPKNKTAVNIIEKCGFPLAAPSANSSGKPSPTKAIHVYDDLKGKIPLIIDGGDCDFGIESTVVIPEIDCVRVLRPGGVSNEEISRYVNVVSDKSVTKSISNTEIPLSPGTKYRHYAPKAKILLISADTENFNRYYEENYSLGDIALIRVPDNPPQKPHRTYGTDENEQAHNIFAELRVCDKNEVQRIFIHSPLQSGIGLAVYNRLIRAADFQVVEL